MTRKSKYVKKEREVALYYKHKKDN